MKKLYITLTAHPLLERRLRWFISAMSVAGVLLILRFWYIQILDRDYYLDLAERHRIRNVRISAPRGMIQDRDGNVLASTSPNFVVELVREEIADRDELFARLAETLGIERDTVEKTYADRARATAPFYPVVMFEDLTREQVVAVETQRWRMPGVRIGYRPERTYESERYAAHLVGYVSQMSGKDAVGVKGYSPESKIGKAGLEGSLEPSLKGQDGVERIEVDALGRKQKVLYRADPVVGGRVRLTIDLALQKAADKALGAANGAVIAISPKNGEILAMVSHPSFDPNLFVTGFDSDEWRRLRDDPYHPLQNKALQGAYPPGSTFKLVTAVAALEEGVIDANTAFRCTGSKRIGNRDFRCWNERGHGTMALHAAMAQSCDVFFYEIALKLGPEKIADYARRLGFGENSLIGLGGELSGTLPTPEWKRQRFKKPWYTGDTASFGIGQGFLTVTPLQLALAYATFANGGALLQPVLVKEIETADGTARADDLPRIRRSAGLKPSTVETVRRALVGVVSGGTGKAAAIPGVAVAGKTGTAQVVGFKDRKRKMGGKLADHAWFASFAPAQDPQVAVAVFVMHGGHGGGAAAPVAREVVEAFLHLKREDGKEVSDARR